jgi:hypothetical protein
MAYEAMFATPSNVVETKEGQQMRLEELRFGDKTKYETIKRKCISSI